MKIFRNLVVWLLAGVLLAPAVFAADVTPVKYGEWCSRSGDCLPLSLAEAEFIRHDEDRAGWKSTGRWLSVHSPQAEVSGTVGVCRFFTSTAEQPFHWFGAEGRDCDFLQQLAAVRDLSFEGFAFRARLPNPNAPRWQNPCGSGVPVFVLSMGGDATYRERLVWDPVLIDELRFNGWSLDPAPLFCAEDASSRWEYANVPPYEEPVYPTVNVWQYEQIVIRGELVDSVKYLVGQWSVDQARGEVCSFYQCRPLDLAELASQLVQESRSFESAGACDESGWCPIVSRCELITGTPYRAWRACQPNEPEYWLWGRRT